MFDTCGYVYSGHDIYIMSENIFRLKQARVIKGLSLREAAKGLGISHESVSKFEKGKLKMDSERLIQFANFYGVTVDYLVPKERPKVELGEIVFFKVSDDGMRIKHFKAK